MPIDLMWPSVFITIGLAFDLLQYVAASSVWGIFHRVMERKYGSSYDEDISAPAYLNWPAIFCFWAKLICVTIGYVLLMKFAIIAIHFS